METLDRKPGRPQVFQRMARVTDHESAGGRLYRLRLHCPEIAAASQPGQFVMLSVSQGLDPLLPRALAVTRVLPEGGTPAEFELLYLVVGRGTAMLRDRCEAAVRDHLELRVLGPLGRGFWKEADADEHVLVGGGCGVAPLMFWARALCGASRTWMVLGARDASSALARKALDTLPPAVRVVQATDDGSLGEKGTAVEALGRLLDGDLKGRKAAAYVSGPEAMLRAAHALAKKRGFACQLSLEARVACGMGVCRSCVVDGVRPHPETGLKRHSVCTDGPVFAAEELDWE